MVRNPVRAEPGYGPVRVGDCAQIILEEISGQRFYDPQSTSASMIKDGEAKNVKPRAQEWYAEFQRKGEKQQLIEAVARGDENSSTQAGRLVKKYPEAALAALQAVASAMNLHSGELFRNHRADGFEKGPPQVHLVLRQLSVTGTARSSAD